MREEDARDRERVGRNILEKISIEENLSLEESPIKKLNK